MSVGGVGAGMKGVVEGKIVEAFTGAGAGRAGDADDKHANDKANGAGADEVAAGGGPEGEVGVKTPNFRSFLPKSDSSSRLI